MGDTESREEKRPLSKLDKILFGSAAVIFLLLVIFVIGFFMADLALGTRGDQIRVECRELTGFELVEGDLRTPVTLPADLKTAKGETVVLETTLPDVIYDDTWIDYSAGKDTEIYVDGRLRKDFEKDTNTLPGGAVKSLHLFVELYPGDAGATLRIVRNCPSLNNGTNIRPVYIGTSLGLIEHVLRSGVWFFILSAALVPISLMAIFIGILLRYHRKLDSPILSMGVGVLFTALWLIFDSELYPFAFRNYYIDGTMSYFMMLLTPLPFLHYMNHMQMSRYRKVYEISALTLEGVFVLSSIIHFSGTSNYLSMLPLLAVAVGGSIGAALVTLVLDVRRGYMHTYGISFVGLMGFIAACVLELLLILLVEDRYDGTMIILGLYWMITMAIVHQLFMVREAQAEAAMAQRASETKSNFLANMSHEIRTPMNAILGMDEMILREATCNDKIKKYASDIKSAGNLLLSIINDILDISKIESGKAELIPVNFDICSVINDLLNIAEKRAMEKDLVFIFDADENIPVRFCGDEIRIRQILLNIINNAIKYTEKGEVRVHMKGRRNPQNPEQLQLEVSVKDTGIGIRQEDLEKLFQPFDRLEQTKNRNVEGTGLGLHIANEYVHLMGGSIGVESTYGEGSEFTVRIPLQIVDGTPIGDFTEKIRQMKASPEDFAAGVIAPAARALVVDDNEMNLEVISGLLESTKMKVDTALSGPEGIRMLEERRYDIIFLDQMMPGMDGISTLKAMKSETLMRGISVVALTADAVVGSREYYLANGFDDYLSKPVRMEALEGVLRKHLPKGMILSAEDIDRINRADEARKVSRENLRSVLVVDEDSEALKDVKARMEGAFKGTFVTGQEKAERYLQKHDTDYVMISYQEYRALKGEDTKEE